MITDLSPVIAEALGRGTWSDDDVWVVCRGLAEESSGVVVELVDDFDDPSSAARRFSAGCARSDDLG
jgi:hypothetical protein